MLMITGQKVKHPIPSNAEAKNKQSYASTPPDAFMALTGRTLPLHEMSHHV
jgi:hypothetical protein